MKLHNKNSSSRRNEDENECQAHQDGNVFKGICKAQKSPKKTQTLLLEKLLAVVVRLLLWVPLGLVKAIVVWLDC